MQGIVSFLVVKFTLEKVETLSEAISSLGCKPNSSSGSMLIRQVTEAQLLTSVELNQVNTFPFYFSTGTLIYNPFSWLIQLFFTRVSLWTFMTTLREKGELIQNMMPLYDH